MKQTLSLGLAAIVLATGAYVEAVGAGEPTPAQHEQHHAQPAPEVKETPAASQSCQMLASAQQLAAELEAMDGKLADLAARMNAAAGADRLDATVAVVNELLAQRQQLREKMAPMQAAWWTMSLQRRPDAPARR